MDALLEFINQRKNLICLFLDVLDIGVLDIDLYGFELSEFEDENGEIYITDGLLFRDSTN